jgi:hypothetical protein
VYHYTLQISSQLITSVLTGADFLYRYQFAIDSEEAQVQRETRSSHWGRREVEEAANSDPVREDRGI